MEQKIKLEIRDIPKPDWGWKIHIQFNIDDIERNELEFENNAYKPEYTQFEYTIMGEFPDDFIFSNSTTNYHGIVFTMRKPECKGMYKVAKSEKEALDIVRQMLDSVISYNPGSDTFEPDEIDVFDGKEYVRIPNPSLIKEEWVRKNINKAKAVAETLKRIIFEEGRYKYITEE